MPEAKVPAIPSHEKPAIGGGLRAWLSVFLAAFVLYALTANRGAQWQDSGFHILRVVTGESVNPLGLALSHPLHHWLGRFIASLGLLEPCFAVTLLSALAGAIAVATTHGCVLTLTHNRWAALFAAASLGLANVFWQMATVAETYTLAAALLSAECWCLMAYAHSRRPLHLTLACLFNGLGIANHLLASLTTPVVAVVLLHAVWTKKIKIGHLAAALALWLLGSAPYGGLVVAELIRSGDFGGTIHSALFGHTYANRVLGLVPSPRLLLISAGFIALSFPSLLLPGAVYGMVRGARLEIPALSRRVLLAGLLIHLCFVARYNVLDQHFFLVPSYVLLSIFGGIGFAIASERSSPRARSISRVAAAVLLVLTPIVYAVVPAVARKFDVLESVARHKPYRDDYVYVFSPWSVAERSAERMSRHAVELAGERGVILVEDPMAEFAIRYRVIRDRLEAVMVTGDITVELVDEAIGAGRPVVLVPSSVDAPKADPPAGRWKRVGDLYVLVVR